MHWPQRQLRPLERVALALAIGGLAALPACDGRDIHGCWKEGDDAFLAVVEAVCGTAVCEDMDVQECIDWESGKLESVREIWCYDGCTVDELIVLYDRAAATCTESDIEAAIDFWMTEGPFWDASDGTRSCLADEQGWEASE